MQNILTILVILFSPYMGGVALSPKPESPLIKYHHSMIKPVKAAALVELKTLDFAPYHYAPIGTYSTPYPVGQCTSGVASMKGNIPVWGNAAEWADNARAAGYTVSSVPIIGSVAQRGGGYGHVATVVNIRPGEVEVTEQNYDWNGGIRTVWVPVGTYQYIWI